MVRWAVAAAVLLVACVAPADAQNLFEVQVFPDETLERGETELEFHNVLMPSGTRLPDAMRDPNSHLHLSLELTHGWTDRFETGLFVETSPSAGDGHPGFAGWHLRPKFRFRERRGMPFHVSLSVEYAFIKQPGDTAFRQAAAVTPIFERHSRAVEMSFNPALEFALTGPGTGMSPVFEPSAKIASKLTGALWAGVEYYAEAGPIRRFEPFSDQHHVIFSAIDLRTSSGWDLNIGVGRGLTGASEHWVVKSIVGVRLRQ